jgi:hypothetical protein
MSSNDPIPGQPPEPVETKPAQPKPRRRRQTKSIEATIPRPDVGQKVTTKQETTAVPAESKREETSRLKREEETHAQGLWERKALFIAGLALFGIITLSASGILLFSGSAELRNWSSTCLTSILTGFLAYLLGKQSK